ncbi:hypothetical protein JDV02_009398 [Purpureocillium takamizusanense]|uniref:JmjC domain-containing protein n=1 Tax=Purpureocillium takamizusanense TaxID=2060973 RepID=A0A9Q8QPV7_9HYPO|nr:uncharacterized protein JDV02_009398 [Purpureocillium takamizusanense]UNI23588.1 hypothetical protein JDV02_009398 [Purpureocillium takamizusanense]
MHPQPSASHDMMELPRSADLNSSSPLSASDTFGAAAMDAPISAGAAVVAQGAAPLVVMTKAPSDGQGDDCQTPATPSRGGASGNHGLATVVGVDAPSESEADSSLAAPASQSASDKQTSAVPDRDPESWVAPPAALQTPAAGMPAAGDAAALATLLGVHPTSRPQPPQPLPQLQPQPRSNPTSTSAARTLTTPSETPPSARSPTESTPATSQQQHFESAVPMGLGASKPSVNDEPAAAAAAEPSLPGRGQEERDSAHSVDPQCPPPPVQATAGSPADHGGAHGGLATPPELEPAASDDKFHIDYDYDDAQGHRILRLKPTTAQWDDFPAVLAYARKLGAEGDGCFKVIIPQSLCEPLPDKASKAVPANAYRVKQIRKTTFWQVSTVPSDGEFSSLNTGPEFAGTVDAAFKNLRRLFKTNKDRQMRNVRYRVDVPAWTPRQRLEAGVPERSPLHPLKGDKLDHTKAVIPGIHTPYVYESGPYFGATFQIHAEDFRLASLNHLYKGRKIWIVIPSTAVDIAEKALGRGTGCSQFMRHRAEFFFPDKLDKLGIPYRFVDQRPGETIVILPDAYHEGFSTGYTIAEAKNYADASWNTDAYQPCDVTCKLVTAIPAAFMRPLDQGEMRLDLCAAYGDDGKLKPLEVSQKRSHDALGDGVDVIAVAPFVSKSMQSTTPGGPDLKRVKV